MAISENARGAIYMSISMAAFTLNDTAMKAATKTLPLFEAIALRGGLSVIGLFLIGLAMGSLRLRLPRSDAKAISLRCFGEIGGTILFLLALMHMPLANLSAIMQFMPLAVTLAAAVIFREHVGWRRMTAILAGFIGVMIIIQPGAEGFDSWSVMGLASVVFVVIRDLATRNISRETPSLTVALWSAVSVMIMGICVATVQGWQGLTLHEALLVGAAALSLMVGYLFSVMVMRIGDIGFVAPFRYTALLFAIVLGWVSFGTLPERHTLLGSAIVVASGIYLLLRERHLRMAAAAKG